AGARQAGAGATVPVADVPVGGGKIVGEVVVTQPTKGVFRAFSVVCTHQGCPVSKIADGQIECTCHGSMFDVSTGAPTQGPATAPLAAKTATVKGTDVVVS
ncbi:MAG: Rieske (2Fe-2S) protein, partial [Actinomycetota bacterium]|nr:Rieske (2Fe-2S) protein [Actinomycetota bacterium]